MKKIIFSISILLIALTTGAQEFKIGPKVGLNYSRLSIKEIGLSNTVDSIIYQTSNGKAGFVGGVFARIGIGSFYIQPEVLFSQDGGTIKVEDKKTEPTVTAEEIQTKFWKMDIPVMLGFRFFKVVRIQAGPVFTLPLSPSSDLQEFIPDSKKEFKSFNMGYQAGLGFDIKRLTFDFKYEGAFGNTSKNIIQSTIPGIDDHLEIGDRRNIWQFTVGWKFL